MTWALWISFATVSAVNIVTPGPANLNTVRRTVQLGARRVVPTILGNALGLAVGGAFCAAGLASVLLVSEVFWSLFRGLGVAYLAWVGLNLLITREVLMPDGAVDRQVTAARLFREAFMIAATNPKALLFYLALFPQVLDPRQDLALQASVLILTYCGLSIASLSTWSALAQVLRRWMAVQARYDTFRRISGILLLGFAGKLMFGL